LRRAREHEPPRPRRSHVAPPRPAATPQLSLSNSALARILQRDGTPTNKLDPKQYKTFGDWVTSLPTGSWNDTAVNVTGEVRKSLPDLAGLVDDLRADCADVTILLRHYYLEQHGDTATVPGWDASAKKPVSYPIGKGVTRRQLRNAVVNLGTIHFQERGRKTAIVDWYLDAKKQPIRNLKQLVAAGLKSGDLLVWKKRTGIKGNFSGHVQTIKSLSGIAEFEQPMRYVLDVVQGTMENGTAKGEIQTKMLSYELLTGKADGNADITFQPGGGEEEFFGAGRWK
jgi:hypothetical protein